MTQKLKNILNKTKIIASLGIARLVLIGMAVPSTLEVPANFKPRDFQIDDSFEYEDKLIEMGKRQLKGYQKKGKLNERETEIRDHLQENITQINDPYNIYNPNFYENSNILYAKY